MIPKNLDFLKNNQDFIDYFIYYYEYTFIEYETFQFDIRKELQNIVDKSNFDNYDDLWVYCYLKINYILVSPTGCEMLKDDISWLASNFNNIDEKVFDIQIKFLEELMFDTDVCFLRIRPLEQLKLGSPFTNAVNDMYDEIFDVFEKHVDNFSITAVNKICFVKVKNQRFITYPQILMELYAVILFETIDDLAEIKNVQSYIRSKLEAFVKQFKQGRYNKELVDILTDKAMKFIDKFEIKK